MKKLLFFLPVALLLASCAKQPQWTFQLSNVFDTDMNDVPVVLSRAEVEENLGGPLTGEVVLKDGDQTILVQADDLDGDGNWDELVALVNIPSGQTKSLVLTTGNEAALAQPVQRTNVRMARKTPTEGQFELVDRADRLQGTATEVTSKYFQYEGPGWENDKIAFRNYFDERNGMDIFGKTTTEMILPKIGVGASYHELQDWGMDILKVGNSLGAGAIALLYQDSLFRVTAPQGATYRLVAAGPLRSTFDLDFAEVKLSDRSVGVKHRISIVAGVYGYQSQVFLDGDPTNLQIVSGIVNMHSDTAYLVEQSGMKILYTFDRQSFNEENLGMALMATDGYYQNWFQTADEGEGIIQTYALACRPDANGQAGFWFLAGWELSDDRFKTREGFETYLREEANRQSIRLK